MSLSLSPAAGPRSILSLVRRFYARRAARREADAVAHLDPAILADIGLPMVMSSGLSSSAR
jgi:hypothetical protein